MTLDDAGPRPRTRSFDPAGRPTARLAAPAVDWHDYAQTYDVLVGLNPAYRALVAEYERFVEGLWLEQGDVVVEVGAGTGNFSLAAAATAPGCHVRHIDASAAMNAQARRKALRLGLSNVSFVTADVHAADVPTGSAALVTAVHALYAIPNPLGVIEAMHRWLAPGGMVFACEPGRAVDVGGWRRYILGSAAREHGVVRAAWLLWRLRGAARQNRRIAAALERGAYWRHDAAEFRAAFEDAGFIIRDVRPTFRGASDLLIAEKPLGARRSR